MKIIVQPRRPRQWAHQLKKAQETIGREIFWQLPNDYRVMVEVRNNGVPLIEQAPKAAITQSIIAWPTRCAATGEDPRDANDPTESARAGAKLLNLWPGRDVLGKSGN